MSPYLDGLGEIAGQVLIGVAPLVAVTIIYHFFLTPVPRSLLPRVVGGVVLTVVGIIMFLQGVHLGFVPAGEAIGQVIASGSENWLLVPLGIWLGLVSALAEPFVRVLAYEVEEVAAGAVPGRLIVWGIALGVAVVVGLAMLRVLMGIPLMYILIPGYALAFLLAAVAPRSMVPIAFDSGAVATGPIVTTFVLAVSIGAAEALGGDGDPTGGFGLVALVALAPIVSLLILGALLGRAGRSEGETQGRQGPEEDQRGGYVEEGEQG